MQALGLLDTRTGESLLELESHPDFRADVLYHESGRYTVAFRGTSRPGELWPSVVQGAGFGTPYYIRAMEIGQTAATYKPEMIDFTGHSLGGGLASAAGSNGGGSVTTFNTSGLHQNNIPRNVDPPEIRDWYVRDEILNGVQQSLRPITPTAARRRVALDPVRYLTNARSLPDRLKGLGGRVGRSHGIAEVRQSLNARRETIESLQKEKGC